jgi:antitoxin PrlF
MPTAKITSKGQITIPIEVRKALNLKPGDRIEFFQNQDGEFVLFPKNRSIRDLEGCLAGLVPPMTIEEMDEAIGNAVAESFRRSVGQQPNRDKEGEAA